MTEEGPRHGAGPLVPGISRSEAVVRHLQGGIRAGTWAPGDRLGTKDSLRREYGIAGATLNEALRVLQMSGLVDVRPGSTGGVFVAEPPPFFWLGHSMLELRGSASTVADLIAVRDCLDPLVVSDAALHRTPGDVDDLRILLERMRQATGPTEALRANWQLHSRIAEVSPNAFVRTIYNNISALLRDRLSGVVPDADFERQALDRYRVHEDLVDAIADGDVAAGLVAIRQHEGLTRRRTGPVQPTSSTSTAPPAHDGEARR